MTQAIERYTNDTFRFMTAFSITGSTWDLSKMHRLWDVACVGFLGGFIAEPITEPITGAVPGRVTQILTLSEFVKGADKMVARDWNLEDVGEKNCAIVAGRIGQATMTIISIGMQKVAFVFFGKASNRQFEVGAVSAEMLQGVFISSVAHLVAKLCVRFGTNRVIAALISLVVISELIDHGFSEPFPELVMKIAAIMFVARIFL